MSPLGNMHSFANVRAPCDPLSSSGSRFALLIRGEAFRAGCDQAGMQHQLNITWTQHALLVEPLVWRGHCVDILLSVNGGCHGESMFESRAMSALQRSHGPRLRALQRVDAHGQGQAVRYAISLFNSTGGGNTYDHLLLLRHDTSVRAPPRCDLDTKELLLFAAPCPRDYAFDGCVQDIFFALPRSALPLLHAVLVERPIPQGGRLFPACGCFDDGCLRPRASLKGNGHNCLNEFQRLSPSAYGAGGIGFGFCSRVESEHETWSMNYGDEQQRESAQRVNSLEVDLFHTPSRCPTKDYRHCMMRFEQRTNHLARVNDLVPRRSQRKRARRSRVAQQQAAI